MFPEETHQQIVERIDQIESEVYAIYRKLERFRISLQEKWRVLPSGEKWTPARHNESELSQFPASTKQANAERLSDR